MFLYEARARARRARARARASYRNISCTIGNPFGHDWDQEGSKTEGNPSRHDFRHGFSVQADHVLAHDCILGGKSAPTFPALDKLWSHKSVGNMGKKRSKAMEPAHYIGCGLGEACQTSLVLARRAKSSLETRQKGETGPQ